MKLNVLLPVVFVVAASLVGCGATETKEDRFMNELKEQNPTLVSELGETSIFKLADLVCKSNPLYDAEAGAVFIDELGFDRASDLIAVVSATEYCE
jgi:hypothetical protein